MKVDQAQVRILTQQFVREIKALGRDTEKLLIYLGDSGFYDAPSSAKYHSNFKGGLIVHSMYVYRTFLNLIYSLKLPVPMDTARICGLLHDICKAKLYIPSGDGYTYFGSELRRGHGKYSVEILSKLLELSEQEKQIIRFHMGPYSAVEASRHGEFTMMELIEARNQDPLIALFHYADNIAAQFLEN